MRETACPRCAMTDVVDHEDHRECLTCGHEWAREPAPAVARVVKGAHGNVLSDGDSVTLIKDLKLKGSSQVESRLDVAGYRR